MDYTSFLRYYYLEINKRLNEYSTYHGATQLLPYKDGIDKQYVHYVETNFEALPDYTLNINAPNTEYLKFFEYYSMLFPSLYPLIPNQEGLKDIYEKIILGNDDDKNEERIDLYIDIAINILLQQGVIS